VKSACSASMQIPPCAGMRSTKRGGIQLQRVLRASRNGTLLRRGSSSLRRPPTACKKMTDFSCIRSLALALIVGLTGKTGAISIMCDTLRMNSDLCYYSYIVYDTATTLYIGGIFILHLKSRSSGRKLSLSLSLSCTTPRLQRHSDLHTLAFREDKRRSA